MLREPGENRTEVDRKIHSTISLGCGLNQTVCGPIMCSEC